MEGDYEEFMAIDFACVDDKIAIECDGPHHYLTQVDKGARLNYGRENGRTIAKRRLLAQKGWAVLCINYKTDRLMNVAAKHLVEEAGGMKMYKKNYVQLLMWREYKKRYVLDLAEKAGFQASAPGARSGRMGLIR